MGEFRKIKIIDGHTHPHGALKKKALFKRFVQQAKNCGLKHISLLSCTGSATHVGDDRWLDNLVLVQAKILYPRLFYTFGGIYHFPAQKGRPALDFAQQAKLLKGLGFDGVKMIEGKPIVRKNLAEPLDHAIYNGYYEYLQAAGMPILFHVVDPEEFWDKNKLPVWAKKLNWFYDKSYPTKEQVYREIENILKRFPRLKIIFAHFYFLSADIKRAGAFLDRWKNVSFDITPGSEMYFNFSGKPDAWREFFIKYQNKIVFGTDNFDVSPVKGACEHIGIIRRFLEAKGEFTAWGKTMHGLHLPRPVLEKIYFKNFVRYAGKQPKKINLDLAQGDGRIMLDPSGKLNIKKILKRS